MVFLRSSLHFSNLCFIVDIKFSLIKQFDLLLFTFNRLLLVSLLIDFLTAILQLDFLFLMLLLGHLLQFALQTIFSLALVLIFIHVRHSFHFLHLLLNVVLLIIQILSIIDIFLILLLLHLLEICQFLLLIKHSKTFLVQAHLLSLLEEHGIDLIKNVNIIILQVLTFVNVILAVVHVLHVSDVVSLAVQFSIFIDFVSFSLILDTVKLKVYIGRINDISVDALNLSLKFVLLIGHQHTLLIVHVKELSVHVVIELSFELDIQLRPDLIANFIRTY